MPPENYVLVIPPPTTDGEIRSELVTLAKEMTIKAQVVDNKVQSMVAQANREVESRVKQNPSTTASHLREFTRMNRPMFLGSKVNEDPQDLIDEVTSFSMLWVGFE